MSPLPILLLRAILALIFVLTTSHPLARHSYVTARSSFIGNYDRTAARGEVEALLKWKSSLKGQGLPLLSSWNATIPSCSWVGISCDSSQRIVSLNMSGYNLSNGMLQNLNFSSLHYLTTLVLINISLSGTIPPSIGNLSKLNYLDLSRNHLSGNIPPGIANIVNLSYVNFQDNNLEGTFPREFGLLRSIRFLYLGYNQLAGTIPSSVGNMSGLLELCLVHNELLHGMLPARIAQYNNLTLLKISNNNISGALPSELGNMKKLGILDLSTNHLSVGITKGLAKLKALFELSLENNELTGSIPLEIGTILTLRNLSLSKNKLVGPIPKQLGNCINMLSLNLSGNELHDSIPVEIGSLRSLESLDLSGNSLVGEIPEQFGQLQSLETLNLSHNNLSAFRNASIDVVRGNKGLCGGIVGLKPCPLEIQANSRSGKEYRKLLVILLPIFALLLLLMVTFGFWYIVLRRAKRNAEDQLVATDENLFTIWSYDGVIMYENIIEATEEFDSKYCIGSGAYGSVYKARLSTNQIVAVKKFHILPDGDIVGTTGELSK
ncbi:hypothetical protein CRG98_043467 [Punica granatum]|uniref:non-specific serine/threonine protein kinase n=1 Tax=Punica granatum TaxID=22663 RepID=A0A2I0HX08_PUNGR|nr:hypothetical protein CRG98_043467 [Punica granatum]